MAEFSRRKFLALSGVGLGSVLLRDAQAGARLWQEAPDPTQATTLQATMRNLEINGKAARVMGLLQPDGTQGITSEVGRPIRVVLENKLPEQTAIHWHGLHPPNNEDGVPGVTQPPIRANASVLYEFPLKPAGTHWMQSHLGLQEAWLLSAPLIVRDPAERTRDEQEVVIMLGDFSFTPPEEIFAQLRKGNKEMPTVGDLAAASAGGGRMGAQPDANDVDYDAYLANDRTLSDPDVIRVDKGGWLRLRIINGSSGTNYFVDLGSLSGEVIATDGMPVEPVRGTRFPLAIAQRIDVRVQVPAEGGAFPVLALRELSREQTGVVLATAGSVIARLPEKRSDAVGLLTAELESRLRAVHSLGTQPPDQVSVLRLQGDMAKYDWLINGASFNVNNAAVEKPQVRVKRGHRVALKFVNETPMSHPMHLHGHSFQVIDINGQALKGAKRDTLLVPGDSSMTVLFEANNPGLWYVHCHVLWHLAAGMATTVEYDA